MKVKDVLAKIGDGPLRDVLAERGYHVFKADSTGLFDMAAELEKHDYFVWLHTESDSKIIGLVREQGYAVLEDMDLDDFHRGYEMYRAKRMEEFRQWLRNLFWEALGRIA